jgi:hypothetical protein
MSARALVTAPSWLNSTQWTEDCFRWRGQLLTGVLAHWCWDWDGLPVDETCIEATLCCTCFEVQPLSGREDGGPGGHSPPSSPEEA